MSSLYELTADFKAVAAHLEEIEMDAETIRDTLDGYSADFDNKVIAIASLIRNIDANVAAIKEAEANMIARHKAMERKADWLREYVINNMQAINKESVECPLFAIKVRVNQPSVVIDDDADIPTRYINQKIVVTPDKKAIKEAIESGENIKGVSLIRSSTLSIK